MTTGAPNNTAKRPRLLDLHESLNVKCTSDLNIIKKWLISTALIDYQQHERIRAVVLGASSIHVDVFSPSCSWERYVGQGHGERGQGRKVSKEL